jgi:cytochrome c-type biogenesis protein CcmF
VISTLGRVAVLLALAACSVGTVTGAVAAVRKSDEALRWTRWMAWLFGGAITLATVLMEVALLTHDFSVGYVAEVGSRSTPVWVTIVSLWSSLNGSILLWAFVLGIFTVGFTQATKDKHPDHTAWALSVILGVSVFFTFLVAGVANPFEPVSPVPADGPGPNPLLQNHILMVVHPPMLYLGYVGMTVPFGMGCAALLAGKLDAAWVRALRRWMLVPWGFLTVGIILGGWWSYEVLGWGGWWAWDPVENASFLPWLTATAFVHSAMVMERKEQLKGWTIALVQATFLLTLLGTFMTRSGVFNSVHSFTQSPIGPVFLGFLAVAMLFSIVLLAARMDALLPGKRGLDGALSRDGAFLLNNLLFAAFTLTVLVGTVYPLLNEAMTDTQISVGAPYFDKMSAPIGAAIVFLMGVGPALPWGRVEPAEVARRLALPAVLGVVATGIGLGFGVRAPWVLLTYGLSGFALVVTTQQLLLPALARSKGLGESLPEAAAKVAVKARRRYGGYIVHVGVLCIAVAHATATVYQTKQRVTFVEGQATAVDDYTLTYRGSEWQDQPHRKSMVAHFDVTHGDSELGTMDPRLNHYKSMGSPIGTPIVRSGLTEDLYLSLVNVDPAAGTASLEILILPLVWWLWFGGALMGLGTLIAGFPVRKRATATRTAPGSRSSAAAAGK